MNGQGSVRVTLIVPIVTLSRSSWHEQDAPEAPAAAFSRRNCGMSAASASGMNMVFPARAARRTRAWPRAIGYAEHKAASPPNSSRRKGDQMERVVLERRHRGRACSPSRRITARRDRVEHRLHVRGRAGDHLQDLGRRGLPLERLLRLVEQTHILIAITACAANDCTSRTCGSSNGPGARRVTVMMPTALPSFMSGANSMLRYPRARAMSRAAGSSSVSTSSAGAPLRTSW